jgi:hypothetical protein
MVRLLVLSILALTAPAVSLAAPPASLAAPLVEPLPPPPTAGEAPPGCGADALEPNDARRQARRLEADTPTAATGCLADIDWFSVRLEAGQTVEVRVEHPPGQRVVPKVFPPRRRKPVGERGRDPSSTWVRVRAARAGTYRVKVRARAVTPVPYTVHVRARGGGA